MTVMVIGLFAMVVLGCVTLAFAFSPSPEEESPAEQPVEQPAKLVFFQPTAWTADGQATTVEEVVSSIEAHLRKEREVASAFARDPSARTLWVD